MASLDYVPEDLSQETKRKLLALTEESTPEAAPLEVSEYLIRHWCETLEDGNPRSLDEAYATSPGHGGPVAPPGCITRTVTMPLRGPWPPGGGDGDAELVIYNFGTTPEAGGSVEANFVRWCGQFVQADGGDSMEVAVRREAEISGMAVHTIDISGRYVAAVRPGNPEKHDKPDHRMLASVIISPEGKYFLKLLGPSATVEKHAARYEELLRSLKRN